MPAARPESLAAMIRLLAAAAKQVAVDNNNNMKAAISRSSEHLDKLLLDLHLTLSRADPRTADKAGMATLEVFADAMDAVFPQAADTLGQTKAGLAAGPGGLQTAPADRSVVYDLLSPVRRPSLFSAAVAASKTKTRSNEFRLELGFLPRHASYLLQASEGQAYKSQLLTLFSHRAQPLVRQGAVVVTAFELLAVRLLHCLASLRGRSADPVFSDMTRQSGYANVHHALLNEYFKWFRESSESSGLADLATLQMYHRFLLCMAQEFFVAPVARLRQAAYPRPIQLAAVASVSTNQLLVACR
jgi:hypothetical protein